MYLCHRSLVEPNRRNDALALAGLGLAFFARTQLVVLAIAFPLVVVLYAGPRRSLRAHGVLAAAYTLGLLVAAALFLRGSLAAVVGNYAVPFSGDLVPAGLPSAAASHLVHVVVGCAVVPFVLAAAWVVLNLVRPERPAARAYAVLCAVIVPLLTFEVASFDLRFTPEAFNQDRYLFYLAPLFAVGAAAALVAPRAYRELAAAAAVVFAVFGWLVLQFGAYDDETVIFWAAPAAAVHTVFANDLLLVLLAAALVACTLGVLWRSPRYALGIVATVFAVLGAAQALYVYEQYADPAMTRTNVMPLARDWIDRRVPPDASVALVPAPRDTAAFWWEAELWNKRVDRLVRVNDGPVFSPFPTADVSVDFVSGTLRGPSPSDYLVLSGSEKRFAPVVTRTLHDGELLKLVQVPRPYRLEWATRGVTPDGWTLAGKPAMLRVYGHGTSGRRRIVVVLAASSRAALPLDFALRGAGQERAGWVDPGGARPPVRFNLCIPARGHVDLTLTTRGAVRIPDGRLVGLHLDRIASASAGACEAGQVSSL
jgi:hypothetical protein